MRSVNVFGCCTQIGVVGILVLASGCPLIPPPPPPSAQPDMKAIVAVVAEAYGQLEQAASVFLGADDVEDTTMARVRTSLSDDLASTFRPPSARISGDPGASIALGRFNPGEDGRLSVVANYVQEDGTGRGCTQYTLEREGDDWLVAEAVDVWPNCLINTQGEESFRDALERAQSADCLAFGTGIGMCGAWLYVVESSGFVGTESYYDLRTGLIVAQKSFTDVAGADFFVFGQVECQPEVTETIPCDEILPGSEIVACGSPTPPDALCLTVYEPVCGEDGRTYSNNCNACRSVMLYSLGECPAQGFHDLEWRTACEATGGVWRTWSRLDAVMQRPSCNLRASDAGLPCDGPMDCEGECFPENDSAGECTVGVCSEFRRVYGCFDYLDDGVCRGVCVD